VVVNLDPFAVHDGVCVIPPELGLPERFDVVDGLTGETYDWGGRNYVRLGPGKAHVLEATRT
jgi:starch synthase (maltosyl-transferring)